MLDNLFNRNRIVHEYTTIQNTPSSNKREKAKRRHSIIGIIFTIPLFLLVASGLPWSGFMGNQIYKIASSNESLGYPKLYMAPPESKVKNCRGQQEKAPPESNLNEPKAISVDELQKGIEIKKPYVISLPADPKGVFTVSKSSGSGITGMHVAPNEEITAYFDQYSGSSFQNGLS